MINVTVEKVYWSERLRIHDKRMKWRLQEQEAEDSETETQSGGNESERAQSFKTLKPAQGNSF